MTWNEKHDLLRRYRSLRDLCKFRQNPPCDYNPEWLQDNDLEQEIDEEDYYTEVLDAADLLSDSGLD
jgi:hypothetical protein